MITDNCAVGGHDYCRGFIPMRGKVFPCRCECHSAARGEGEE